jgi:ABC-2 type transport system ATP-binding protein
VIEVEHLSKVYSGRKAVDDISFKVDKGEILGFLGPNGAGKTTTMRILTCYMPATDGTARVAGYDVFEESLEVRKRIGYLPENPPLYPEMTVASYLHFVSRIKGSPSPAASRTSTMSWENAASEMCATVSSENSPKGISREWAWRRRSSPIRRC